MLQVPSYSTPVYGRSHIKKFWLQKSEKEADPVEHFHMNNPVVSQQLNQIAPALSSCEYRKLGPQSPAYVPITNYGSMMVRMISIGSSGKLGAMPSTPNQTVVSSACGSEISSESLASRMMCTHVAQAESSDGVSAMLGKARESDHCGTDDLGQNVDRHVNIPETLCSQSLGIVKSSAEDIPPRHSRSGSPVLITYCPNHSSKLMSHSGIGLQNFGHCYTGGEDRNKEVPDKEITDCEHQAAHSSSALDSQQVCSNESLHPHTLDEIVMDARNNFIQPSAAFLSGECGSKAFPPTSNSKSGHATVTYTSPSFRSEISHFHRRMDSVGTDGCSNNVHESVLDTPLNATGTLSSSTLENTARFLHRFDGQKEDISKKIFCTETFADRIFSKEAEYTDEPGKTTNGWLNTNVLQNQSSFKELITSLSPNKTSEQINDGGSSRNVSRICSHCGTMKTPLWRSGPSGPKSLCNACGIRLKKAGRRLAMSEGMGNCELSPPTPKPGGRLTCKPLKRKMDKVNGSSADSSWTARAGLKGAQNLSSKKTKIFPSSQFRKSNCKETEAIHEMARNCVRKRNSQSSSPSTSNRRTSLTSTNELLDSLGDIEDFEARSRAVALARHELERLESTNRSPFRRAFAKDEEEGAVLLMALSYGLVNA